MNNFFRLQGKQQPPQRHLPGLCPQIKTRVRNRGQGKVYYAFVRAQPAKLRVISQPPGYRAEIRHERLDLPADKRLGQVPDRRADQFVAHTQGQRETCSKAALLTLKPCNRVGVFRARVDRIGACTRGERESRVFGLDGFYEDLAHIRFLSSHCVGVQTGKHRIDGVTLDLSSKPVQPTPAASGESILDALLAFKAMNCWSILSLHSPQIPQVVLLNPHRSSLD